MPVEIILLATVVTAGIVLNCLKRQFGSAALLLFIFVSVVFAYGRVDILKHPPGEKKATISRGIRV